jgi:signal transduction histidine kinase
MKSRRGADFALLWRAVLIVLPVAVLSGIALYSLRQDRASIEREARDRARVLAPNLAGILGKRAGEAIERRLAENPKLQGRIVGGQIQSPPDYPRLPVPASWPSELKPDQARLWQAAQDSIYQRQDAEAARKALTALAEPGGSPAARANAEYGLLLLAAKRGAPPPLVQQSLDLARRFPTVLTESGTPLADLALLVALNNSAAGVLPELTRRVSEHPSFLTPELLDAAERAAAPGDLPKIAALKADWMRRETTLALLRAVLARPLDQAAWVDAGAGPFLALSTPNRDARDVVFLPAPAVEQAFTIALKENQTQLPAYAGAAVEMAGRRWRVTNAARMAGEPEQTLASEAASLAIAPPRPFTLHLELASPELLYASYRRRLWLTAGLVLSAAAAALMALVSLWRGFRRQVRLSEMKSNFVSSVSHELRAPIAAVRLMSESLNAGRINGEPKQREYLRLIVQECRRLSSLVENVLDFSRIDQGRKQYSFEPVDLQALVRETVALMEPCASEKQVSLSLVQPPIAAAELQPNWDGHAVEQALVNLLDNAIKHSPAGTAVKVEVEAATGNPSLVRLWVEDQGEGIPVEEQTRIFELFYRHGSELRRETQGVGIGLSIVKHIAEAHGGKVLVESAVGRGSRFALELPVMPPAVQGKA